MVFVMLVSCQHSKEQKVDNPVGSTNEKSAVSDTSQSSLPDKTQQSLSAPSEQYGPPKQSNSNQGVVVSHPSDYRRSAPAKGAVISEGQIRGMSIVPVDLQIEKVAHYRLAFRSVSPSLRVKYIGNLTAGTSDDRKDWKGKLEKGKHEFQIFLMPAAGLQDSLINYQLLIETLKK
jgi:hypothetical protein